MNFPKPSKLTTAFSDQSINRPQFHFTPEFGWMNDPNGLWKDGDTYHLYYQYNPSDTVWALPLYWGHATSTDLITWTHDTTNPLPIGPVKVQDNKYQTEDGISVVDPDSGAYSGSIFIDDNNQTGWFSGDNSKKIIAAWTYNYPNCEKQWLSYSDDGNIFYNPVENEKPANPMVEDGNDTLHFRDPQVIKLNDKEGDKNVYIMTVAKPQEYKIYFYASTELKTSDKWVKQVDLELEGFLGYQYECPNLIHLYNKNTKKDDFVEEDYKKSYWVLFISINPGSINGGSSTWYLIGQFAKKEGEKYKFTPTYHYPAPLDYGKDFYAMQIMYNSGKYPTTDNGEDKENGYESYIGIAWASNWQYTGVVPTDPWRSSMSLARKVSLGFFQSSPERKILYIKSEPIIPDGYFTCTSASELIDMYSEGDSKDYTIKDPNGSFQFQIEYTVNTSNFSNINPGHLDIKFICKDPSEYLLIGYENEASAFYVDRSHSNVEFVHNNPYFSDKISVNLQPFSFNDEVKTKTFKVNGFVDRNIIELFFNDGYQTMTNTFFFTGGNFFNSINVSADYGKNGYSITVFKFCPFSKKNS